MARRRRRLRIAAVVAVLFALLALAVLGGAQLLTERSALARSLAWRESDIGDRHRFPGRVIPRAGPVEPRGEGTAVERRRPHLLRSRSPGGGTRAHRDRASARGGRWFYNNFNPPLLGLARFGRLLLHEGRVGDRRIVSRDWVR